MAKETKTKANQCKSNALHTQHDSPELLHGGRMMTSSFPAVYQMQHESPLSDIQVTTA